MPANPELLKLITPALTCPAVSQSYAICPYRWG